MSFDVTQPVDSNGYGIVQGYNVVPEMLRMIQSEQFNINWFLNLKKGILSMAIIHFFTYLQPKLNKKSTINT